MAKKLTATQKAARPEKKMTKKQKSSKYSSFWLGDEWEDNTFESTILEDDDSDDAGSSTNTNLMKGIKLAAFKRSAGNFVRILTGKAIPVEYAKGDESYTDGERVTISGKVEGQFDSTVGLALHEASHIVHTNFKNLRDMIVKRSYAEQFIPASHYDSARTKLGGFTELEKGVTKNTKPALGKNATDQSPAWMKNRGEEFLFELTKQLANWIEDRRIDNETYQSAPGYRGYYDALYERYFNSKEVDDGLKGNVYTDESIESYMFRIFNMTNAKSNPDALVGLRSIINKVDVKNIGRLKSYEDSLNLTKEVLGMVLNHATKFSPSDEKNQRMAGLGGASDGEYGDGEITIFEYTDDEIDQMAQDAGVSPTKMKKLLKKILEQSDLINGQVDKKVLSKAMQSKVNTLMDSSVEVEQSGGDEFGGARVNVIVIDELNDAIVNSPDIKHAFANPNDEYAMRWGYHDSMDGAIRDGIIMGKMLGKRLAVRNEERTLKFTRQLSGRIDRRLVNNLAYDVENVFSKIEIDKFKKTHVHISVDASGSMGGEKLQKAVKTATAIAQACSMVSNIECVVSFRTTLGSSPFVYVAYDSRRNGIPHLRKYFRYVGATGSTPESLCYEAMMHSIIPVMGRDEQLLFVNISDGEPAWSGSVSSLGNHGGGRYSRNTWRTQVASASAGQNNTPTSLCYSGDPAYRHTARMMKEMQMRGGTILAYLIGSEYSFEGSFVKMYGRNNSFNINNAGIEQIARTLNKKFLEASSKTTNRE